MRSISLIVFCLNFYSFGQVTVGHVFEELPRDSVAKLSVKNHSEILPEINCIQANTTSKDSVPKQGVQFSANELIDVGFRYGEFSQQRTGIGFTTHALVGKKWYATLSCIQGFGDADTLFQAKSYTLKNKQNLHYSYRDIRGRISFTPNKIFNFQAGLDNNFIGEGNRSVLLSDYGKPYPFAQIRTKLGRVEYVVLYQLFREQTNNNWLLKNGATHYLSFNVTKNLYLGVFESVIFQPKDTLLNRGFDVEYLNPVIFYRPQEYALGSSDNSLLGGCFALKNEHHTIYGQVLLDEFFLAEIKAKTGWWANKYAGQCGLKGRFNKGHVKYFYRLEYNFARPYTYSHISSGQNYGNQGMTLAHPLGGNFREIIWEMKISQKQWLFKIFACYFIQGKDKDSFSYGSNIYAPYTLRPADYGNYIGQGVTNRALRLAFTISYELNNRGNLNLFCENQLRFDSYMNRTLYFPIIGLRSQLWNDYRNY